MKITTLHRLAVFALLLTTSACDSTGILDADSKRRPVEGDLKVLFIGHSLTSRFNMPFMFEEVAEANGHMVYVQMATRGNATLEDHRFNQETRQLIASQKWDIVAMQDARYRVAFAGLVWELVEHYAALESLVRDSSPDARILINMWFPERGGARFSNVYYDFETLQRAIWSGTVALADSLDYTVAPVGAAWLQVMEDRPDIGLFDSDQSHPSYAGQYLQACIHFGAIWGEGPTAIDDAMPTTNGTYLRQVAGEVILSDPVAWNLPGSGH